MATKATLFARRYRAALLDYLLGSREEGLTRGYDLGRSALNERLGLLQILRAHQKAVNAVMEPASGQGELLERLRASQVFLMEALSPFEMTYRGFVAMVKRNSEQPRQRATHRPRARAHG